MKKIELFLPDANSTRALGAQLAQNIAHQAVVILEGELGAGKTTLVQGIGQALGIAEPINSPTFTMLNEYNSGRLPLYHLDLYRINNGDSKSDALEFFQLEMQEYLSGGGIVVIEWAEPIEHYLPDDRLKISLSYALPDAHTGNAYPGAHASSVLLNSYMRNAGRMPALPGGTVEFPGEDLSGRNAIITAHGTAGSADILLALTRSEFQFPGL